MYLTGTILLFPGTHYRDLSEDGEGESFRAYVQFDRGCITTTKCSCGERNWCRHVLALCLARVNESAPLQLHPPISETLTNLDREQLQKLVQYVLEKLPLDGVAAVQEIASSLLDKGSEISQLSGAPGRCSLYHARTAFGLRAYSIPIAFTCSAYFGFISDSTAVYVGMVVVVVCTSSAIPL